MLKYRGLTLAFPTLPLLAIMPALVGVDIVDTGLVRIQSLDPLSELNNGVDFDHACLMPRNLIESDSTFIHPIPYVVFTSGRKTLGYNRPSKTGESKLAGNFSIGFGGHLDLTDCTSAFGDAILPVADCIRNAMQREVSEELGLSLEFDYKADTDKYYLIYDTSNEVGKTHLGVVCIVQYSEEVLEQLASDRHDEIENLRLIDNKDLQSVPNPENWTKFIIESGALTK